MPVPDLGRSAAVRLYEAARAGEFHMSEAAARGLADSCDRLAERIRQARADAAALTEVRGFPDLPSGHALTRGFAAKGQEYLDTLSAFEQTALCHKAAYLAAAALFREADAATGAALARTVADTA
ncbi:hypothetical protein ACPESR_03465 [Nocardia testacea]|uniref:hypothetical protein n=1 Tax=Nocardia testacea TaxID=248551 RepID=UPI003C2F0030